MTPEDAIQLLEEAGEDEEKLTLASIKIALSGSAENRQNFMRECIYAAAVPHWFNAKILRGLMDNISSQEAEELYATLKTFSFVEDFPARGANIHERTRLTLLRWMIREHPKQHAMLSSKAAKLFSESRESYEIIESLYHALIVDPDETSHSVAKLCDDWMSHGRVESCQALAVMLEEHLGENRLNHRALATALDVTATIEWRYRPLDQIEDRLQRSLQIFHDLEDQHSESVVLDEIGEARRARGLIDQALHAYVAALALTQKLATDYPGDSELQFGIALHHNKIGRIRRDQGGWDDARRSHDAALTIIKKLVKENPENKQWERGLALSQMNLGDIQHKQQRMDEAVTSYRSALAIMDKMGILEPENTEWRRDLSLLHTRIGDVILDQKKPAHALQAYKAALALAESLVKQDDKNMQWQRDLSVALGKVGEANRNAGNLMEAKRFFEKSLAVALTLVAHDSANAIWQKDREVCQRDLDQTLLALQKQTS